MARCPGPSAAHAAGCLPLVLPVPAVQARVRRGHYLIQDFAFDRGLEIVIYGKQGFASRFLGVSYDNEEQRIVEGGVVYDRPESIFNTP